MGFNAEKFRTRVTSTSYEYKKSYNKNYSKGDFPFVGPADLTEGVPTPLRFLPSYPERNPDGFRVVVTHQVPQVIGEKKPAKIFCPRADDVPGECACCELLEAFEETKETLTETEQKALDLMKPNEQYLFPAAMPLMADPAFVETTDKKFADILPTPDGKLRGVILKITQKSLKDDLLTYMEKDPHFNDERHGRTFTMKRNHNSYDLVADPFPSPMPPECVELYTEERYPRLMSYFGKTTQRWTYAEMAHRLMNAYWAQDLGINFGGG